MATATNYFLLCSGNQIIGPGSQPATYEVSTRGAPDAEGITTAPVITTEPLPLPANCIPCTQAQAEAWQTLELVDGVLQAIPAAMLLATAQTTQKATLRASAQTVMVSGFVSSALGSPNTYPSTLTDQHNLAGSVIASLLPNLPSTWTTPYWCMNSAGTWTFAEHTAAQIQQVGLDGKAWVQTQQTTLATLSAQVEAATTVATVQTVTWS